MEEIPLIYLGISDKFPIQQVERPKFSQTPARSASSHVGLCIGATLVYREGKRRKQGRVSAVDFLQTPRWYGTSPYVNELGVVTLFQVVQDRRVVEVRQVGHILGLLILGRVDLRQLVLLEVLVLLVPKREKRAISRALDFGHLRKWVWRGNAAWDCVARQPRWEW